MSQPASSQLIPSSTAPSPQICCVSYSQSTITVFLDLWRIDDGVREESESESLALISVVG